MQQDPIVYSPELRAELVDWLEPVGYGTDEHIDRMQRYANQLQGAVLRINRYTCPSGHQTFTRDRDKPSNQKEIPCPFCKTKGIHQQARSHFYMCDQTMLATYEFYTPKNIWAFPKTERRAIRKGALAFKSIYDPEPGK